MNKYTSELVSSGRQQALVHKLIDSIQPQPLFPLGLDEDVRPHFKVLVNAPPAHKVQERKEKELRASGLGSIIAPNFNNL